jgi:hypothetical protein
MTWRREPLDPFFSFCSIALEREEIIERGIMARGIEAGIFTQPRFKFLEERRNGLCVP